MLRLRQHQLPGNVPIQVPDVAVADAAKVGVGTGAEPRILPQCPVFQVVAGGVAGTLVPITGFANAVVSPALDFKAEGFVTGMAAKMFVIAGPVIVYGTLASVVYGVVLWALG